MKKLITILGILEILSAVKIIFYFYSDGYLVAPFFLRPIDSFMDFYNTLYWSFSSDKYTTWQSIYTPFTFLLSKFFTYFGVNDLESGSIGYRNSNSELAYLLLIFTIIGVILNTLIFKKLKLVNGNVETISLFFVLLFTFPVIFVFERGNLIIISYVLLCLSLLFDKHKGIFFVLAISIKQYLAIILIPYFLKFNKKIKFIILIAVGFFIINFLSAVIINDNKSYLFLKNMLIFGTNNYSVNLLEKAWLTSTFGSIDAMLFGYPPLLRLINTETLIFLQIISSLVKLLLLIIATYCLYVTYKYRNLIDINVIIFQFLLFTMVITDSLGPYSPILLMAYIPYIIKEFKSHKFIYLSVALLSPFDFIVPGQSFISEELSYLSQINVYYIYGLSFQTLTRWFITISFLVAVTISIKRLNRDE